MKTIVLITMILAIMAPVLGQQSKFKLYECNRCSTQRQSQYSPPSYAGKGGCVSTSGNKSDYHSWSQKR